MESSRGNRTIYSAVEIQNILQLAKSHRWPFSYIVSSERRQTSHTTEIVKLNPETGCIVVGSEVKYSGLTPSTPTVFRAMNGGITLQFESELIDCEGNALANRLFTECQIRFPAQVRFSQMRKAVRVDCSDQQGVVASIFANGSRLKGTVMDISESGLKIRFEGNLSYQFKTPRLVTDCRVRLADGTQLDARVRMLGFLYDRHNDISLLRCQLLEIRENRKIVLQQLITSSLSQPYSSLAHC